MTLKVSDSTGGAISGLTIEGRLFRPATDRFDRRLGPFDERTGGIYQYPIGALDSGTWITDLVAYSPSHSAFHMRERLWLPPRS
jgi:hypothetical protein